MSLSVLCVDGEFPRARADVLIGSRYFAKILAERSAEDVSAERLCCEATLSMFRCVYESLAFGAVITPCCNAEAVLRYYRAEMSDEEVVAAVGDAVASIGAGAAAVAAAEPAAPGSLAFSSPSEAVAACAPAMWKSHADRLRAIKHPVRIELYFRGLFGDLKFTVPAKSKAVALFTCNVNKLSYSRSYTKEFQCQIDESGNYISESDINEVAWLRGFNSPVEMENVFGRINPGWIMLVYAL